MQIAPPLVTSIYANATKLPSYSTLLSSKEMFSLRCQPVISLPTRFDPAATLTLPDMEMQHMLRGGEVRNKSRERMKDSSSMQILGGNGRIEGEPGRNGEKGEDDGMDLSRTQLMSVVAALVCSIFLCSLDTTIIATAIPRITDRFHSLKDVGWYGSAFLLTIASSQSSWGKAYKHFDLKAVFLVSIAIFELGSLICAVAQTSATLIVGRAITGLGAAGVVAGCYSIIAYSVAPHKRPAFTGILGGTYGIASVLGPLLGGLFTDSSLTWRWCFWINLPIGAASAAIIYFIFTTPLVQQRDPARRVEMKEKILQLDLPGMLVLTGSIVSLLLAMQWGGVSRPWDSGTVISLLVVFVLLIFLFGMIEYRQGERAMLVPHVIQKREVWAGGIFVFFVGAALFTLVYFLPIYFQAVQGTSAVTCAIQNLALILTITISTIVCGAIITLAGRFTPLLVLGSVLSTVGCALIYNLSLTSTLGVCIGSQVLAGVGLGLSFQTPVMAAQALSETEDLATTSAILVFFQTMGGAIFVSAAQSAFANKIIASIASSGQPLSPAKILTTGATGLRQAFPEDSLDVVRTAYMEGLTVTFIITLSLASTSIALSPLSPWVNIKGKVTGVLA